MSDEQYRQLQRYASEHPTDYPAQHQYLQLAARLGLFDPADWSSYVAWATNIAPLPPRIPGQAFNLELEQAWERASEQAELWLHHIRNTNKQRSAADLVPILTRISQTLYREPISITISTDYGIYPVIEMAGFRIIYDERYLHVTRPSTHRPHLLSLQAEPRHILDAEPQYILETDVYHSGNRWEPPDVESYPIAAYRTLPETLRRLLFLIGEQATQDGCYDPREETNSFEESNHTVDYCTETLNILGDCLARTFSLYKTNTWRNNISVSKPDYGWPLLSLEFQADDLIFTVRLDIAHPERFTVIWPDGRTQIERSETAIVDLAWRNWLQTKLVKLGLLS